MTTLLNRTDDRTDELVLIRSEPISMQWTNELRRNIGLNRGQSWLVAHREKKTIRKKGNDES